MRRLISIIILSLVLVLLRFDAQAQWEPVGPYGGTVTCFIFSGTNLFAGTEGGGILLSTNNGANWTVVNTGLTNGTVFALAAIGTNLFVGTSWGVYRSTN